MTVRIVRLGSPRHPEEGLRIGTVRRAMNSPRLARAYCGQSPMRRARSTSWVLLPSTIESTVIV